jgi:hypothetical protein
MLLGRWTPFCPTNKSKEQPTNDDPRDYASVHKRPIISIGLRLSRNRDHMQGVSVNLESFQRLPTDARQIHSMFDVHCWMFNV